MRAFVRRAVRITGDVLGLLFIVALFANDWQGGLVFVGLLLAAGLVAAVVVYRRDREGWDVEFENEWRVGCVRRQWLVGPVELIPSTVIVEDGVLQRFVFADPHSDWRMVMRFDEQPETCVGHFYGHPRVPA